MTAYLKPKTSSNSVLLLDAYWVKWSLKPTVMPTLSLWPPSVHLRNLAWVSALFDWFFRWLQRHRDHEAWKKDI